MSLSKSSAAKFESGLTEEERSQVATIYGEDSDAEQYLAPIIALKLVQ